MDAQRDNLLYGNTYFTKDMQMKMPRMGEWTAEEIRLYKQGFKQGMLYERHLCLEDCSRVYERIDNGEPALAVQSCIEEIQERAEKENAQ